MGNAKFDSISVYQAGGIRLIGALDAAALGVDYCGDYVPEELKSDLKEFMGTLQMLADRVRLVCDLPESDDDWEEELNEADGITDVEYWVEAEDDDDDANANSDEDGN
jgi:hypothetical protein